MKSADEMIERFTMMSRNIEHSASFFVRFLCSIHFWLRYKKSKPVPN